MIRTQNWSLTQKFVPTTRKTVGHEWTDLIEAASTGASLLNIQTLLRKDIEAMARHAQISPLAIAVPRAKGKTRAAVIGKQLASCMFPAAADELTSRIQFDRLLARLSRYYRDWEEKLFNQESAYRRSRTGGAVWTALSSDGTRGLSEDILRPRPAPLSHPQPRLEAIMPLVSHLEFNEPLDNDLLEFPVGIVTREGKLDLFKRGIGPELIDPLLTSLRSNDFIKHVLLGNNFVGARGAHGIANFLITNRPLVITWYLGGNEFSAPEADTLLHAFLKDEQCTSLWLKRNPLCPGSGPSLRRLLQDNRHLELLDLQNTGLLDSGTANVIQGLCANTALRALYLDANGITDAVPIASYLNLLTDTGRVGITRLWLSMNRLGDMGVRTLCRSLSNYIPIRGLSLGSNGCSAAVAEDVYLAFRSHPNLQFLDLGMYKATADLHELTNRIGDEGLVWICQLIRENTQLRVLSISCNGLSGDGLSTLADALRDNHSLVHVEYFQYGLKMDQDIRNKIDTQCELNWIRLCRDEALDPATRHHYVRVIKHSKLVSNIDSFYD